MSITLLSWNFRILAHEVGKNTYFQVHEVYYDANDIPTSYTENPVSIEGEDLKEIEWDIDMIKACLDKPVLWHGKKFPQEYKK